MGSGVGEPAAAQLYKLLVYDRGSFSDSHRDTEKTPGTFATPVIVLPSISAGAELVVRHKGREVRLNLCCSDPSEASFAASMPTAFTRCCRSSTVARCPWSII